MPISAPKPMTLPFRNMATKGVMKDPNPYQLDLDTWSTANNIIFQSNKAERSPVFKPLMPSLGNTPAFAFAQRTGVVGSFDTIFYTTPTGSIYALPAMNPTNVTPTGFTPVPGTHSWTGVTMAGVTYLNRPEGQPYYWGPNSSVFAPLPGWSNTWSCRSLRAYGNQLVAMNVTKGGTVYPNLLKISDLTLQGQPPGTWDQTNLTTSADEIPLEAAVTPLIDGAPLRSAFVIYTATQAFLMQSTGDFDLFTVELIFNEGGILSPNCVVEKDGKHFVFGQDDLYVHDGVSKQSIAVNRVREYLFRYLDRSQSEYCFVQDLPQFKLIVFAYSSLDSECAFPAVNGCCNRGAVYNLATDTWSFIDLPYVVAGTVSNLAQADTFATMPAIPVENMAGDPADMANGMDPSPVFVGNPANSSGMIWGYDFANKGNLVAPIDQTWNAPATLERVGIALDQVGSDLSTYKTVSRLYPLISLYGAADPSTPFTVQYGGSMTPQGPVVYGNSAVFDPMSNYKVDGMFGGRYVAVRFQMTAPLDFDVAGFDLDVLNSGRW